MNRPESSFICVFLWKLPTRAVPQGCLETHQQVCRSLGHCVTLLAHKPHYRPLHKFLLAEKLKVFSLESKKPRIKVLFLLPHRYPSLRMNYVAAPCHNYINVCSPSQKEKNSFNFQSFFLVFVAGKFFFSSCSLRRSSSTWKCSPGWWWMEDCQVASSAEYSEPSAMNSLENMLNKFRTWSTLSHRSELRSMTRHKSFSPTLSR